VFSNPKLFAVAVITVMVVGLFLTYLPQQGGTCIQSVTGASPPRTQKSISRYVEVSGSPGAGKGGTGQADAGSDVVDGSLYVVGGYGCTAADPLNAVSVYSPENNSWHFGPAYPVKVWGLACTAIEATLFCFGGDGAGVQAYKLDTLNPVWTRLSDLPSGYNNSQGHVAVSDPNDGLVFIMGSSNDWGASSQVWAYDAVHDSYARKSDMPYSNAWFTAAYYQGRIYVFGGVHGNGGLMYDIANDSWSELASGLPGPSRFGMIRNPGVASGLIPIVDGRGGSAFYNLTYFYNVSSGRFFRGPDTLLPRDGIAGGIIEGKLYVVGGRDDPISPIGLTTCEQLDMNRLAP
jgi:hypothetical protein